ncbi:FliH/SctL family protein [Candidatus Latescibacterota bacterium]
MKRVIKKSVNVEDKVVVGDRAGAEDVLQKKKNSEANWNSLEFSKSYTTEISEWKDKLAAKVSSQEEIHRTDLEKAYNKGYEEGLSKGIEKERSDCINNIDILFTEAKKKSRNAVRNTEIKVIELASALAEKIIRKSVLSDSTIAENIVTETMSHLIGSETVVLKVSHEDYTAINEKYKQWLSMAGNTREFSIEIDKRLKPGDCTVETEGGIIDGIVLDRLDVLVEEMLKISK